MTNLKYPFHLYIDLMRQYTPDVVRIFDYMNGRINKRNICKLYVSYFSRENYAHFQYPNSITVFLGSIINNFYDFNNEYNCTSRDAILSVVALCIAHELNHADQDTNSKTYSTDVNYAENIENAAEYNAEKFCVDHIAEFKSIFGFEYVFERIVSPKGYYEICSPENFYPYMILGLFRNYKLYTDLLELIITKPNIYITIIYQEHMERFNVKLNGVISLDPYSISIAANILGMYREGSSTMYFEMKTRVIEEDGVTDYIIDILNRTYSPFSQT